MASPSTNGLLRLQALGENLNTWGLSNGLNGNFNQLDDAVWGIEAMALTGNKTLTSTNYSATNEIAPRIHRLTDGGLSAAPTITIPARDNWWLVFNTTAYAVTYDNGSNSASVTAGRTAIVYTDGTNVYSLNIFTSADQTYPGALSYAFSTTTTDADPGSGNLRLDNATQGSATGIYISDTDGNAADVSAFLLTWDDSTSAVPCRIILRSKATPANFHIYAVTALTDNAGYMDFTVTHVDGNGSLANGEAITVTPVFNGDKGDTGPTGPAGGLAGGTLTGDIDADNTYTVENLKSPQATGDAVPLGVSMYLAACFGR